jgi:hypothetical protein
VVKFARAADTATTRLAGKAKVGVAAEVGATPRVDPRRAHEAVSNSDTARFRWRCMPSMVGR